MSAPRMIGKLAATVTLTAVLAGLSAGTATAAPRTGPSMAPNSFTAYANGHGPTLADAETDAEGQFDSTYYGCGHNYYLVSSSQQPDGTWYVRMSTTCTGWI
jgi:hypothetical protein